MTESELITAFEQGELQASDFHHATHLQVAYYYLETRPFLEACIAMRDGLKSFVARIGKEEKYHETVTLAFMCILAERRAISPQATWEVFLKANPDLLTQKILQGYYTSKELTSDVARKNFILPQLKKEDSK